MLGRGEILCTLEISVSDLLDHSERGQRKNRIFLPQSRWILTLRRSYHIPPKGRRSFVFLLVNLFEGRMPKFE